MDLYINILITTYRWYVLIQWCKSGLASTVGSIELQPKTFTLSHHLTIIGHQLTNKTLLVSTRRCDQRDLGVTTFWPHSCLFFIGQNAATCLAGADAGALYPTVCVCVLTGVVCGVGALGPPDGGGVAGVRTVWVQRSAASFVLLADLRQVVHAEATQLLRDGSLTLPHTHTHRSHIRQHSTDEETENTTWNFWLSGSFSFPFNFPHCHERAGWKHSDGMFALCAAALTLTATDEPFRGGSFILQLGNVEWGAFIWAAPQTRRLWLQIWSVELWKWCDDCDWLLCSRSQTVNRGNRRGPLKQRTRTNGSFGMPMERKWTTVSKCSFLKAASYWR